jgi:hypothetical protein
MLYKSNLIHLKFKFDAPVSSLKSKNRISDSSDLWTGRIIKVPENEQEAKQDEENAIDETPEAIGFIKVFIRFTVLNLGEVLLLTKVLVLSSVFGSHVNSVHVVHRERFHAHAKFRPKRWFFLEVKG